MDGFLRRCRGVLGMGATWGVAWGALFAGLAVVVGLVDPGQIDVGEGPLAVGWIGAVFGFVSGVGLGVLLSVAERRKSLLDVSPGRAALLGALATAVYPLMTQVDNSEVLLVCPVGAALAVATVAVAKRAEIGASRERPSLPG
jgi:hypothetical protein